MLTSRYEEENIWDLSVLYFDVWTPDEGVDLQMVKESVADGGYDVQEEMIGGFPAMKAVGKQEDDSGSVFNDTLIAVQKDDLLVTFEFYLHEDFGSDADPLFDAIVNSLTFAQ